MSDDIDALIDELAEETRDYIQEKTAPIEARVAAVESYKADFDRVCEQLAGLQGAVKAIEERPSVQGPQGEQGIPGERGEKGPDGAQGERGIDGKDVDEDSVVARVLAAIPTPKDGRDGEQGPAGINGKDADEDAIVARVLATIRIPDDGKDGQQGPAGKDAEVDYTKVWQDCADLIRQQVEALPKAKDGANGKDGESIHPDTVALMVRDAVDVAVQKAIANVRMPKDGEPGRDAPHLTLLPSVDLTKSYPRGTWAKHAGGMITAVRNTDPGEDIIACGWDVALEGIADESETMIGERTVERTTTYTGGRKYVRTLTINAQIYRGVWREGQFQKGDTVTWGGSQWVCEEPTIEKPGQGKGWVLSVKHGRDGKDAVTEKTQPIVRTR